MTRRVFVFFVMIFSLAACSDPPVEAEDRDDFVDAGADAGDGDSSGADVDVEGGAGVVEVSRARVFLAPGEELRLFARLMEDGGAGWSGDDVVWETQDQGIAGVSRLGVVTGHALGETVLTVAIGEAMAEVPVEVIAKTYRSVSMAEEHACTVAWDGDVFCWGDNLFKKAFGMRDVPRSSRPLRVETNAALREVTTGGSTTCGLTLEGGVVCWGSMPGGNDPVLLDSPLRFSSIGVGASFACGLSPQGEAYCWGYGRNGWLGNPEHTGTVADPVRVETEELFEQLSVMEMRTCGVSEQGRVLCWGMDLGEVFLDPDLQIAHSPVTLDIDVRFESVSVGLKHACGIEADSGRVYCWGGTGGGRLGQAIEEPTSGPVVVDLDERFVEVVTGHMATCALSATGAVWCWGMNGAGTLGDGSFENPSGPVRAALDRPVHRLTMGGAAACAIDELGEVWCWGYNFDGLLGDGRRLERSEPVEVALPAAAERLFAAQFHFCAVDGEGAVSCWGDNTLDQIYPGLPWLVSSPALVPLDSLRSIDGSYLQSCAVDSQGALWCWGNIHDRAYGLYGRAIQNAISSPGEVMEGEQFSQVKVGRNHNCALREDGRAFCWGISYSGNLGIEAENEERIDVPIAVSGDHMFTELAVGQYHSCGISEGQVLCWGQDNYGQLGTAERAASITPQVVPIPNNPRIVALEAALNQTCAITEDHALYCWGSFFQPHSPPAFIQPVRRMSHSIQKVRIATGAYCALTLSGVLLCSGINEYGVLRSPLDVVSSLTSVNVPFEVVDFAMIRATICAIARTGRTYCWGNDGAGSLGQGEAAVQASPTRIAPPG